MRGINHLLLTLTFRWFKRYAPYDRRGDRFRALSDFFTAHGRLPTDRMLFNDYLHRLKVSDELLAPERRFTSDKELVKLYVAAKAGGGYTVPTLAVLRTPEEVYRFDFPPDCVIKPTHASARVCFRHHGEEIDREEIASWFHLDYYVNSRERNYRGLTPKVIVEPYAFGDGVSQDMKVYCYQGEPKLVWCSFDKENERGRRVYTVPDWRELDFSIGYELSTRSMPRPGNLDEMLNVSRALSAEFEFVRVDFYNNGDRIFVGELTHVPGSALDRFYPADDGVECSRLLFGE